jgi:hypothetical protein
MCCCCVCYAFQRMCILKGSQVIVGFGLLYVNVVFGVTSRWRHRNRDFPSCSVENRDIFLPSTTNTQVEDGGMGVYCSINMYKLLGILCMHVESVIEVALVPQYQISYCKKRKYRFWPYLCKPFLKLFAETNGIALLLLSILHQRLQKKVPNYRHTEETICAIIDIFSSYSGNFGTEARAPPLPRFQHAYIGSRAVYTC